MPSPRLRDPHWFKDAIIYETHVRAFFDGNNDGVGDFAGLVEKIDYLQHLGVTCLWLLPFFPSPGKDDGYDIADYRSVNPAYGTVDDFRRLVEAAHARDIAVLVELVVNHTSDQHPWFQAARRAPPGSPEREMYVWSDTDQKYKDARIIFTDTEKSNWTWDPEARAYFWHRFFSHQPDLNFENPRRAGGDPGGDALLARPRRGRLPPRRHPIPVRGARARTARTSPRRTRSSRRSGPRSTPRPPGRLLLAEANQWPADVRPYFGEGDECHMAFHFPLMPRIFMALRLEDARPIVDIMARTPPIPESCQWALFLRNHDELTLEMVTSDERDYMYLAYGADPRHRINVGIRRRLAPLVEGVAPAHRAAGAASSSPFPARPSSTTATRLAWATTSSWETATACARPCSGAPTATAGSPATNPAALYAPPLMDPVYGYQTVNVEAQLENGSSLLAWMRNMIALRKLFNVFGRGSIEFLPVENPAVLAYLRRWEGDVVLCVASFSRFAQPAQVPLAEFRGWSPVEMSGYTQFPAIGETPYPITMGAYGFYWFELSRPPDRS